MKVLLRIVIDGLIIISALVVLTGWRALAPARMPTLCIPSDYGLPYTNITMKTQDGIELKGWFIPSDESEGVIICLHGYPANKSDILLVTSFLYPKFSLLLFDFRAHGESGGRITHFGLKEFLDVEAFIRFIKTDKNFKDKKIGVWGYSLGGAVGIKAACEYKEVSAIVTDSAFANFPEMVTSYYKNMGFFKYIFSSLARLLGNLILKADFIQNSPEYVIDNIYAPILIIHSKQDEFVPYSHAERLFLKAPEPKMLWAVEGTHTGLDRTFTDEYQRKVLSFFETHLLGTVKD
ncbi:alpha/beta fold hydrolase [bacterium]|nr:alpha/beta fold hydrolase [bacterium]